MSEPPANLVRARMIAELRARLARVRELTPPDLETFIARRTEAEALIFAAAVGLRNRIVHQYTTLDLARVLAVVRDDLADLDAFAAGAASA